VYALKKCLIVLKDGENITKRDVKTLKSVSSVIGAVFFNLGSAQYSLGSMIIFKLALF